jgi:uncharacterized protein YrzB (UPF0473 family)
MGVTAMGVAVLHLVNARTEREREREKERLSHKERDKIKDRNGDRSLVSELTDEFASRLRREYVFLQKFDCEKNAEIEIVKLCKSVQNGPKLIPFDRVHQILHSFPIKTMIQQ